MTQQAPKASGSTLVSPSDRQNQLAPPCQVACPVHTDIRGYVAAIAAGDFEGAYDLAREVNPLVYTLGRVCAHPCEDACRRGTVDEPVAICALKRFATEQHDLGRGHGPPFAPVEQKEQRVAIIGSGPAGLGAAYELVRRGYRVTIFEACDKPGGMLQYGLPPYRLPRDVLETDIQAILDLGVELKTGIRIGEDLALADLKRDYDAVFIAVGGQLSRKLRIEGADLEGVLGGVDFLRAVNMGQKVPLGRKVLVIGGGNVAIDVARSAIRQGPPGSREVHMYCLECREEMPAHEWEIEEALKEGVQIFCSRGPNRILGENGRVTGLETIVCDRVFDENGRFNPHFVCDTEEIVECDTIILAIGQASDLSFLRPEDGIEVTRRGTIVVDPKTLQTSVSGIFAGGEVVTGPDCAVQALALGQRAALSIDAYLSDVDPATLTFPELTELGELNDKTKSHIKPLVREEMPTLPLEDRWNGYPEVELGLTELMAVRAAHRCLTCGAGASVDPDKCIACLTCVRVCPYEVPKIIGSTAQIDEQCQACGICAAECPAKAITMTLYTEDQMMNEIEVLVKQLLASEAEPAILGFCCRYCAYAEGADISRIKAALPTNVKTIEVLCTGKIDVGYLLKAFELGVDGVFVAGCPEDDCRHNDGSTRARKRVAYVKEILDQVGLNGARLEIYDTSLDGCQNVASIAGEMVEKIQALGPNPLRRASTLA